MLEHLTSWSPLTEVTDNIKIDDLEITFKRTIRVPDKDEINNLPPDMGEFPLYRVDDYADKLPLSLAQKGGLLIPMHQREAMWINFQSRRRYAIKILVGGINAVSGEPSTSTAATSIRRRNLIKQGKSVQDYVVAPNQNWLDGVAVEPGKVRQFVAMPVGTGHSVEAQMTVQEITAGIQFEITRLDLNVCNKNPIYVTLKTLTGKSISITTSLEEMVYDLKLRCQALEGMPACIQRLIFDGHQLRDDMFLVECGIQDGAVIHLVLNLRGGGFPLVEPEMNITPGGLIRQAIATIPKAVYRKTVPVTFNVQILNSACFEQVTGKKPPPSPITSKTYAESGFPLYSIYEEPTTIFGAFGALRSIAEIDQTSEESMPADMPVVDANTGKVIPRAKVGEVGLMNPQGPSEGLELVWEIEER
ncbi:integral membrane [Fusarium longipes]|uniref:Integral membrane n=1 Tax=Fusarium longipes TaxID=694270 RepID=A0A395RVL7_9HYPO|nr:integral membrane [Fusarium longipes]